MAPRIVRLSARQYEATVKEAFGLSDSEVGTVPLSLVNPADRFSTKALSYTISESDIQPVVETARRISDTAIARLSSNDRTCLARSEPLNTCLRTQLQSRGTALFHRPLTNDELDRYVAVATDLQGDIGKESAAAAAFEAMLRAPQFLFRTEIGTPSGGGRTELDPFEIASAISYRLTDAPPDEALRAVAENGALADPVEIEAQVRRVLGNLDDNQALLRFIGEYIPYADARDVDKDDEAYPWHDANGLVSDTTQLIKEVLDTHGTNGFLTELLTTDRIVVRPSTAEAYGVAVDSGSGPVTQTMTGERMGILTQPSWLVAFSEAAQNLPIQRGKFIGTSFLCDELPAVPIPDIEPLNPAPDATLRETLAEHRENPDCASCHDRMDPMGLPFEQFDHTGRFRTTDKGRPVDTSGGLNASGSETDGPVNDPYELTEALSASKVVRQCFLLHAYEYFQGEVPATSLDCDLEKIDETFADKQDLAALIAGFFTSESFRYRTEAP